jgi:hypothetical protein
MADVGSDNLKPKIITLKVLIGGISESDDNPRSTLNLLSKQALISIFQLRPAVAVLRAESSSAG